MKLQRVILSLFLFSAGAYGYASGPEQRRTGAPGDTSTCISSGCHVGTPNSFSGGNVKILLPGGATTYVPGQTVTIQVQITDPQRKSYGFELTARLSTNLSQAQAGDFAPAADGLTTVLCDDGSVHNDPVSNTRNACNATFPVQFVEHNINGWQASINGGKSGSYTYSFNWTAPASGTVTMYVAANSGTGTDQQTPTDVFTSNITLTPASTTPPPPTPTISAVTNGASFQTTLAANTYASIFGSNFTASDVSGDWGNSFTANPAKAGSFLAPTSLTFKSPTAGTVTTSVTVGGTPAYIAFVNSTQINLVLPNITASGSGVPVIVTVNGVQSQVFSVTLQASSLAPAFFSAAASAAADVGKYAVALHGADQTKPVGKAGLFTGITTTPAKPGETIVLWATGFGATTPANASGVLDPSTAHAVTPAITLGNLNCSVAYAASAAYFQLFQINVVVPQLTTAGDYPLVATIGGVQSFLQMITVAP